MAFISSAFTAGQTLTAASMEDLRGNANAGHSVFTNEAARDAAITAPTEGLMAYLTAPTVPAATGGSTAVPTGVVTIYNGSAWVCVTPLSARTENQGGMASNSYTPTLTGTPGTNPSVTLVTGTTALVWMSAWLLNNTTATGNRIGVAVSGATTIAASDEACIYIDIATAAYNTALSYHYVVTGLTAGTNTFTLQYKVTGGTATIRNRSLTVQGIA